jgi:superoxide dismutase, Fe-Mn family
MFTLPALPYDYRALQPTMSSKTLHLHHDKHHARYFAVVNELIEGTSKPTSLEKIVVKASRDGQTKLHNNAAQAWNHTFFWHAMTPERSKPSGALVRAIRDFGGLESVRSAFVEAGFSHFGSGWVWLAASRAGKLSVVQTHDGGNLLGGRLMPLIVCDLWEHAYYMDYKNDRKAFLSVWFDKLANWALASSQFRAAIDGDKGWTHPHRSADA